MKALILDLQPGISGDMFLAASVGLGFKIDIINDLLSELKYQTRIKVKKISCGHFNVHKIIINDKNLPHIELEEITEIIHKSQLSITAETIALKIVKNLIAAEKKIHKKTHSHTHSAELASLDTLIDAVGTGLAIDNLEVQGCFINAVNIPRFYKKNAKYLTLAPATLEILKNFKLRYIDIDEEIITPTGASIIKTLCKPGKMISEFKPLKASYATGNRELKNIDNLFRLILAETDSDLINEDIYLIETAIDDMTPEMVAYLEEKLFKSGALDVYVYSHYGKKGRVGFTIKVLSDKDKTDLLMDIIFQETTTNGIRYQKVMRKKLHQKIEYVDTKYGTVRIKISNINGNYKIKPEYEDCKKLALKFKIPLQMIFDEVTEKIKNLGLEKN